MSNPKDLHNFRDLGGMMTLDNLRIRKGKVFRTANLSHIGTETALKLKSDFKISTYVDFRNEKEISHFGKPDALIKAGVNWLNLEIYTDDPVFEKLVRPSIEDWFALYQRLFEKNIDHWMSFLKQILKDPDATLYGCIFGKDRTGIATSFLLTTLNVHHHHIHADYSLTTKAMVPEFYSRFAHFWDRNGISEAETVQHYLTAHPEIMERFVEYMNSEDEKLEKILVGAGFDQKMQAALEAKLLEPSE